MLPARTHVATSMPDGSNDTAHTADLTRAGTAVSSGTRTAGALIDRLAQRCFGTAASASTRDGALAALGVADAAPVDVEHHGRLALAFLLAAPEMQAR